MKEMTANQIYKLSGSKTPFSEWIGEQKTKYGEKFNEKFINMSGSLNFTDDNRDSTRSQEQIILENADENIEYPSGGGLSGSVSLGKTTATASAGVSNFPTTKVVMVVGGLVLAYWLYKKYGK
jgi:hypothetical protein